MQILVIGDRADSETGFVGERLEQLGGRLRLILREDFPSSADHTIDGVDSADLVLLLGSHHGVADAGREHPVAVESKLVRDCLSRAIPVIAICYGAQLASHALGGAVTRAPDPEIGWRYVESHDPSLCPPGPWVQYHFDTFTVPEGARSLGGSDAGPQGFAVETGAGQLRLVAWQFHPEVTPSTLERWLSEDTATLPLVGIDAAAAADIVAEAQRREGVSRAQARALIDVALDAMRLVHAST